MADDFNSAAAAEDLNTTVQAIADQVRQVAPPAAPQPLFHTDHSGNVVNRQGTVVRAKVQPLKGG